MRILFIGQVDFSYHCLQELLKMREDVVAVICQRVANPQSDNRDLAPLAKKYGIKHYYVKDINSAKAKIIIKKQKPDIIFCLGWHQLLKKEILRLAPQGVIGIHPTKLPENRGRHPIIWALALGLKRSALTFFKMNESADAGAIVSQKEYMISDRDDAATIYGRIKTLASQQLKEFVPLLRRGKLKMIKQKRLSNVWRKRDVRDGIIDWRMTMQGIYDLVRALSRPYPGALAVLHGEVFSIWKVKKSPLSQKNIEPGKVLRRQGKKILVKCYDGAVEILEHEFRRLPREGEYIR